MTPSQTISRKVLVAGASGALGRRIAPALQDAGHDVVGGSRDPAAAAKGSSVAFVDFDVDDVDGMATALRGRDTLVFLVHRMDEDDGELVEKERQAARRVAVAARTAGVERIVYLGSVQPQNGAKASPHIRARAITGDELRESGIPVVELQGSMVISAESASWRIVRDLSVRLPVMVLPRWLKQKTRPVGVRDVVAAFVHAVGRDDVDEHITEDLPGPELLSVRQVLERTAAILGRRPLMLSVPVLTPKLSAHWIHAVTDADSTIADHLVEGMLCDVSGTWPGYWAHMEGHELQSFDDATAQALEEAGAPASTSARWVEALARRVALQA